MMRILLTVAVLITTSALSHAQDDASGAGNGGDAREIEFKSIGLAIADALELEPAFLPCVPAKLFRAVVEKSKIKAVDQAHLGNEKRNAVNYPDRLEIELTGSAWDSLKPSERNRLVFHENMGLLKIEDKDSVRIQRLLDGPQAKDLAPQDLTISNNEPIFEKTSLTIRFKSPFTLKRASSKTNWTHSLYFQNGSLKEGSQLDVKKPWCLIMNINNIAATYDPTIVKSGMSLRSYRPLTDTLLTGTNASLCRFYKRHFDHFNKFSFDLSDFEESLVSRNDEELEILGLYLTRKGSWANNRIDISCSNGTDQLNKNLNMQGLRQIFGEYAEFYVE
jgi:hypothetical protein